MAQEKIKCPKCGAQFELTEGISREIEATVSQKYETQISTLKIEADTREKQLKEQFKSEAGKVVEQAKKAAEEKVRKQTEQVYSVELKDTQEQLNELSKQLEESRQQELALRKRQRELDEKEKSIELEAMRKIDAAKAKITEEARFQFEEQYRFKDAEKDKKLSDMTRQIDDLKRKAEQGSQQTQGEILELDLESRLHSRFPIDDIEPIQKGIRGGDVLETVKSQLGHVCGKILWECKRTKAWSDSWIQKAKDNQLVAKADLAVIITEVLPKSVQQFEQINGVWVTDISSAINLAIALRSGMIQVARERESQVGKQEKMEVVYNYLTGPEFKNRVEAIVGSFVSMQQDLDQEKRSMDKIWAKREKQIERVISNISGMYGDLEGIASKALPAIRLLELAPEGAVNEDDKDMADWLEDEEQDGK